MLAAVSLSVRQIMLVSLRLGNVGNEVRMIDKMARLSDKCLRLQKKEQLHGSTESNFTLVVILASIVAVSGCKKKMAPIPPAATAPAAVIPAPTAQITATPTKVIAGGQVVLNWSTTNATSASIDGISDVLTSGVKTVIPTASTSYHLMAKGPHDLGPDDL